MTDNRNTTFYFVGENENPTIEERVSDTPLFPAFNKAATYIEAMVSLGANNAEDYHVGVALGATITNFDDELLDKMDALDIYLTSLASIAADDAAKEKKKKKKRARSDPAGESKRPHKRAKK